MLTGACDPNPTFDPHPQGDAPTDHYDVSKKLGNGAFGAVSLVVQVNKSQFEPTPSYSSTQQSANAQNLSTSPTSFQII